MQMCGSIHVCTERSDSENARHYPHCQRHVRLLRRITIDDHRRKYVVFDTNIHHHSHNAFVSNPHIFISANENAVNGFVYEKNKCIDKKLCAVHGFIRCGKKPHLQRRSSTTTITISARPRYPNTQVLRSCACTYPRTNFVYTIYGAMRIHYTIYIHKYFAWL